MGPPSNAPERRAHGSAAPSPAEAAAANAGDLGTLRVANEFADVAVRVVTTHNGVRLEVASPRLGRSVLLDAIELEALTWQEPDAFSALLDEPFGPSSARTNGAAR